MTVSDVTPTDNVNAPTLSRSPPLTATPGRAVEENPDSETSTVYVSGVTFGMTKSPVALVTTGAILVPRASLIRVTDAPGTARP